MGTGLGTGEQFSVLSSQFSVLGSPQRSFVIPTMREARTRNLVFARSKRQADFWSLCSSE
jgi:hypothetical protein